MMNTLYIARDLIEAQRKLLSLHYKYDDKVPDSHLKRFDKLEKEVRRLTELFWQSQVPIHTTNQTYFSNED